MLRKIITVVLFALIAISSGFALTTEDDTLWTRNFGFSGRFEFVQNDEYIITYGSNGICRVRVADGKIINEYKIYTDFYSITPDKEKIIITGDFVIYFVELETGNYIDSIIIEKTNEFKYVDGDTTNPWESSYLSRACMSFDNNYLIIPWNRSGYRYSNGSPYYVDEWIYLVFNIEKKEIQKQFNWGANPICFSKDGKFLAIGKSSEEGIVELYSAKTFEYMKRISLIGGKVTGISFSSNNKYLCCNYAIQKCKIINLENSEVVFPDDNTNDDLIIQTEFYNKKNTILYKELKWIDNKRVLFFNEYEIEKKLKISKFDNLNIEWIYPGLFKISDNDNYVAVIAYSEKKEVIYVLIKNNITEVDEIFKNNSNIKIIPNPIDNILKVDFDNKTINKIEIIDINGISIYKEDISIEKTNTNINTSTFPSGVYLLRLTNINEIETYKFIKE